MALWTILINKCRGEFHINLSPSPPSPLPGLYQPTNRTSPPAPGTTTSTPYAASTSAGRTPTMCCRTCRGALGCSKAVGQQEQFQTADRQAEQQSRPVNSCRATTLWIACFLSQEPLITFHLAGLCYTSDDDHRVSVEHAKHKKAGTRQQQESKPPPT